MKRTFTLVKQKKCTSHEKYLHEMFNSTNKDGTLYIEEETCFKYPKDDYLVVETLLSIEIYNIIWDRADCNKILNKFIILINEIKSIARNPYLRITTLKDVYDIYIKPPNIDGDISIKYLDIFSRNKNENAYYINKLENANLSKEDMLVIQEYNKQVEKDYKSRLDGIFAFELITCVRKFYSILNSNVPESVIYNEEKKVLKVFAINAYAKSHDSLKIESNIKYYKVKLKNNILNNFHNRCCHK